MVNIPFPEGYTPTYPPVYEPGEVGLEIQRELTHWFIMQDPTSVQLIPRARVKGNNGSISMTDGTPRPPQIVKMIFTAGSSDGIVQSEGGQDRQYDFIVVGEWNSVIEMDDYWIDPSGQKYVVSGVSPSNGYEVKANIKSFGPVALYG